MVLTTQRVAAYGVLLMQTMVSVLRVPRPGATTMEELCTVAPSATGT